MKGLKVLVVVLFGATLFLPIKSMVEGQSIVAAPEAPTGFDDLTNGFVSQVEFNKAKAAFEEREEIADGIGPVYNAQACVECHQNPVTGAISQITELRAGHVAANGAFVEAPGGSLINDRAIDASIQERVPGGEEVRTFRTSLNTLGDGFVECIADETLAGIQSRQPLAQRGTLTSVPVLEAGNAPRAGRFGWKSQHASLLSFSSDAYLNEMGITNRFNATENTSLGRSVAAFDTAPDPEDTRNDIDNFAEFMRATKAPPRGAGAETLPHPDPDVAAGSGLFDSIGCGMCHTRTIVTASVGTPINGGQFNVPPALGNKTIHPFSDFLLHDIGTGDGIVQNGDQATATQMRTAPLWGVRTRDRLMHDGESLTFRIAILRHAGQATDAANNFRALTDAQKNQLIKFLGSL